MLLLIILKLFNVFFDQPVVLFEALVTVSVKFLVVLFGVPTPLGSLFLQRLEVLISIHALILQVLLVALSVGLVPSLLEDQLGSLFHGEV